MALFVLIGVDKPGASDLRAFARKDHLAYLDQHGARVKLAGPFLDAAGQPIGSMVIFEAEDFEADKLLQADDPYAKALIFQSSEVRPWRVTVGELG